MTPDGLAGRLVLRFFGERGAGAVRRVVARELAAPVQEAFEQGELLCCLAARRSWVLRAERLTCM